MEHTIPDLAYTLVRIMAREAAKNDAWMTPQIETGDDLEDFGQFAMAHRGQWESTSHYQGLYGVNISDLICDLLEDGFGKGMAEPKIFLLEELQEAFWEEWENCANLYKAWEKEAKPKKRKK